DLSFVCAPGTVTGFLGPNGAGKSTTLRILTGLARADAGEALVGGRSFRSLSHPARTIGVMLDRRALHNGRTGRQTLRLTAARPAARPPLAGRAGADAAAALVGGRSFRCLSPPARTIGVMLDARALHNGRTGRETLRLTAATVGMPASRADEVLETVGLQDAGGKRVGGYSYGMRQRLGIGVALIGDPSVLVLDEPANGLDPEGIRWMRRL